MTQEYPFELLEHPQIQSLFLDRKFDPLSLSSQLLKLGLCLEERLFICEYARIYPILKEKFKTQELLWADSLAIQQSTAFELSSYKAQLFPKKSKVIDLCCGMGGDSLFLDPSIEVIGVDLSQSRLKMFAHNQKRLRPLSQTQAIYKDVNDADVHADFYLLDPDRRDPNAQDKNWNPDALRPTLPEVAKILSKYPHGCIKLSPAADHCALFSVGIIGSYEWIGGRGDCRELLIRTGSLAQNGPNFKGEWTEVNVSAVDLDSGQIITYTQGQIEVSSQKLHSELKMPRMGDFIYEPLKTAVRSHVFAPLACELSLQLIDAHVAYLSSQKLIHHPFLRAFEVIHEPVLTQKKIPEILSKLGVGEVVVKKRGVDLDPNALAKKWSQKKNKKAMAQNNTITVIATRVSGEVCFWICREL